MSKRERQAVEALNAALVALTAAGVASRMRDGMTSIRAMRWTVLDGPVRQVIEALGAYPEAHLARRAAPRAALAAPAEPGKAAT